MTAQTPKPTAAFNPDTIYQNELSCRYHSGCLNARNINRDIYDKEKAASA
jgi:hypothetical protein